MNMLRFHRLSAGIIRLCLLAVLLGCGLGLGPARPAAAAGITVAVDRQGSGLHFHAVAPSAVDWEIQVSTSSIQVTPFPPHFRTGGSLPARVKRLSSNGFAQTTFGPDLFQLAPNTVYNYIVRGGSQYVTGAVRTFQNKVTVLVTGIDVIDDSDASASGELTFHFNAGNGFFKQLGEVAVSDGGAVPMPNARGGDIRSSTLNKLGTLTVVGGRR